MDLLLVSLSFINVGCFLVTLLYIMRRYIPFWLSDLFEWGKTKSNWDQSRWNRFLHVPNSWFTHFYIVGSSLSCALLWMLIIHCFHIKSPITEYFPQILDLHYTPCVNCFTVLVSLLLLLVQCCRRLFECLFISVFTGKIHLSHYLVGLFYYVLDAIALASPLLGEKIMDKDWCSLCRELLSGLQNFSGIQWLGIVVFLWASWHQWNCHVILAKLRHSACGKTVKVYKIPHGDWFDHVSSPHYLAEIIIYFAFFLIQKGHNVYVGMILLFTVQNLSLGATVTHNWYKNKFKEYPQNRYKIFPFLY